MSRLTEALKSEIQAAYTAWLGTRGFKARRGQREMIAEVARTLCGESPRVLAIEAGTGTGKTAAYCLAAIPIARALEKSLVVSTATVALQEQVVLRDLPDLQARSGLAFEFALAKGRRRYVCVKRLDDAVGTAGSRGLPLFAQNGAEQNVPHQRMLERFASGQWNGELDSWDEGVSDQAWASVTTDHRACTNHHCAHFTLCPFFKARRQLGEAEVIVANHDLVLSDLNLGGGAVLPEPDSCIYIIDEAHHLPDKTQNHYAVRTSMNGSQQWLDQVGSALDDLSREFAQVSKLQRLIGKVNDERAAFGEQIGRLNLLVSQLEFTGRDESTEIHRFPHGAVPEALADACSEAIPGVMALGSALREIHELVQEAAGGESTWAEEAEAQAWLPALAPLLGRADATEALLRDYAQTVVGEHMFARWANRTARDLELVSTPLEPGHILRDVLWTRCFAAVCTSATLTALGRFERFVERVGLPDEARTLSIPSPFDYPRMAVLHVPRMQADPRDFDDHTVEVSERLPALLAQAPSALVLFTSWRQLNAVTASLRDSLGDTLLVQGERSKQSLLTEHCARIDRGEASYLVGLASFAEGVDLPGDYCRHVVIVKLPFAVPDDPLDQAMSEWAEARGRNPFMEIAVPDATLKLVQACGRLIRSETDHGRITLLDRRLVSRRYGKAMLDSLPPFSRQID